MSCIVGTATARVAPDDNRGGAWASVPTARTLIAERTVHRVLNRRGLILDEERPTRATKRSERGAPNELWPMDFKGLRGFNRPGASGCPLVILDDLSRRMLALQHLGSTKA